MKPLTLTELARADGMVWIKAETTLKWWDKGWYGSVIDGYGYMIDMNARYGLNNRVLNIPPGTSFLTIPESDEPRLREIERRVNEPQGTHASPG